VNSSKIAVIRNPAVIQRAVVTAPKKEIICYFGRFSREKNLIFLINTFSEWKERTKNGFRLLLIGEGEDETEIRKAALAGGFNEEIEIREYMPHDKLNEVLKEVKYLSLTSNCYENAPMTIIEALSLNIIPIAPDLGGMKESIESVVKCGKTYISGSAESWMETLNFLESNYETELSRLMESQKKIGTDLSTDHYYQVVMKLYKEA
jgi:glycosyltransferase involved in cell wall biosynthesis